MTTGNTGREISALSTANDSFREFRFGKFENELVHISPTFDDGHFCERSIGYVDILMEYQGNMEGMRFV